MEQSLSVEGVGTNPKAKQLFEFGPFRVDPEKQILLRDGEPVPLTPKAFQVLLVLVRRSRQIVSKDDLMKAVWPDTFVEETNLTRNIFALRRALGESEQDRYIITVSGQGYRLAEDVRLVPEREIRIIASRHAKVQIQVAEPKRWPLISVIATFLVIIAAGLVWFLWRRAYVLTDKDTVVLADFSNSTGDPVFDGTLRQGLAVQLEQSPFLSLISELRVRHTLRLMGKVPDARLTPELAREICERTGSAAVLEGSIATLGSRYVVGLRARRCRTGDVIDDELVQAAKKEEVLNALSQAATKLRARVGESLASVRDHDTPLADATTPSLEALEAYTTGLKVHFSSGAMAALPFFKRAVDIDPNFAMAHSYLGRVYANLDESDLSAESIRRAWQLRDRVTDEEKFAITTRYQALVTGNLEALRQTCEAWTGVYRREPQPHIGLSIYYRAVGEYEKAAAESRKAIEIDPDFSIGYYDAAANDMYLGRPAEAERVLATAAGRGLEIDEFVMLEYDLAFLRGDQAAMDQQVARARERAGGMNWMANKQALALAYSGHLEQANSMTQRAVAAAESAGQQERAALWEAAAAIRESLFGNTIEARKTAMAALKLPTDREVEFGAAFALASSGDNSRPSQIADEMEKRFTEDTMVQFRYVPLIRAQIALDEGDIRRAVDLLQTSVPYELGAPRDAPFGALYPIYLRGEAYLAAKQGGQAAAESRKILDHRGIVVSDPIGALAHLQLGRAYALEAESTQGADADTARDKSRAEYQDFLALWKAADRDIPLYKQAIAEYTKLQ